jgi:hypothetical protein
MAVNKETAGTIKKNFKAGRNYKKKLRSRQEGPPEIKRL